MWRERPLMAFDELTDLVPGFLGTLEAVEVKTLLVEGLDKAFDDPLPTSDGLYWSQKPRSHTRMPLARIAHQGCV